MILVRAYESHLISRIIADNKLYYSNADQISERLFITQEAKELYRTFKNLISENKVTDESLMLSRLNNGAASYFIEASIKVDYSIPIEQLITELDEHTKQTELISMAGEVIRMSDKPSQDSPSSNTFIPYSSGL